MQIRDRVIFKSKASKSKVEKEYVSILEGILPFKNGEFPYFDVFCEDDQFILTIDCRYTKKAVEALEAAFYYANFDTEELYTLSRKVKKARKECEKLERELNGIDF